MMSYLLTLVLITLTAVIFWYAGRYPVPWLPRLFGKPSGTTPTYLTHFGSLFTDQPDKAIESFIEGVEVRDETLETHFLLADVMRSRGEIDQAIRLHQNLMAELKGKGADFQRAQYQLAVDHHSAGWQDRAERLFLEQLQDQTPYKAQSIDHLISIYSNQKEWEKALRVHSFNPSPDIIAQSQICCELADIASALSDKAEAEQQLKRGLVINPESARARLGLGQLALAAGKVSEAFVHLRQIPLSSLQITIEALPALLQCARQSELEKEVVELLQQWLEHDPSGRVQVALAGLLKTVQGSTAATAFLEQEVQSRPSYQAISCLLASYQSNYPENEQSAVKARFTRLNRGLDIMSSRETVYRCRQCGFKGGQLHWLCPQCKCWETISPESGVRVIPKSEIE